MKKYIKYSAITTIALYLIVAFNIWDLSWALKAKGFEQCERESISFFFVAKEFILFIMLKSENKI